MIAIVDYGMGNIASITNAFKRLGYDVAVTDQREILESASHIILPGVGSFQAAIAEIEQRGLRDIIKELAQTKPFLGICLGMQILFTEGFEGGHSFGLNLIPGTVEKIETELILPHIGWNTLNIKQKEFAKLQDQYVYFVHSFLANTTSDYVVATTDYGIEVPAIVRKNNVFGMQFHPEKSGEVGKQLLKIFLELGSS